MKLYAPKYYKDFACIADRCRHSCCVGWEIDVDEKAAQKYKVLGGDIGNAVRSSIEWCEVPHFKLSVGERCPHLSDNGLCNIIRTVGEDYLCDICREHPRFYNFSSDRAEAGLGMACEEAARLILSSDEYKDTLLIGETEGEPLEFEIDTISQRKRIYSVLSDGSVSYEKRLLRIYDEFGIFPSQRSDGEWHELISALEYMDDSHEKLFLCYSSDTRTDEKHEKELERALAYFVFRHCTEAECEEEYRASLGFCLFCERLLSSLARNGGDIFELARIVSEELEYSEDNTQEIKNFFEYPVSEEIRANSAKS